MRRACAWCGKNLGNADDVGPVTHGICGPCAQKVCAEATCPLRTFLDALEAPVLLLDSDGRVGTANAAARRSLGKAPESVDALLAGEVFECIHAFEPGGCGGTSHCNGCALRRAINDTWRTGHGHERVRAVLTRRGDGDFQVVVTTEKVGEAVLLRIDALAG
ncbi:MAG: PAS domain-containing protein [Elusimicrobia bacterium]|nr:PAS domain-containing protein [Elusimicrobiota bacterium]